MGGTIIAEGNPAAPITFTANLPAEELADSPRGNWGGLIILGKAPVHGGSRAIEGLSHQEPYGGNDPNDSSGVLKYVRVWYGGAAIAADNEINGITFGGVGAGTTVDSCEVAMNIDDGFEFFGGTVNAKRLSTLYVGDDSFDTDKGYQGKMQYLYTMIGSEGHYAAEMDGNKIDPDQLYSAPQVMGFTAVGNGLNSDRDTMIRLREQTAGQFGSVILGQAGTAYGIRHDCESDGAQLPPVPSGRPIMLPETLYVSSSSVIMGNVNPGSSYSVKPADASTAGQDCVAGSLSLATESTAAVLASVPNSPNEANSVAGSIDLTPIGDALLDANVEDPPAGDAFFDTTDYAGAFAPGVDSWLDGWSYLDCVQGTLAGGSLDCQDPNANVPAFDSTKCGDITAPETWSGNVNLACQVFVKAGATLTIAPGTTVYANAVDSGFSAGTACTPEACTSANKCVYIENDCKPFTTVLVVEQGATINAAGTAAQPITFTANAAASDLSSDATTVTDTATGGVTTHGTRGNWGGLIILGNAPVKGGTANIEGLVEDKPYGGTQPTDSSGVLQYVRVWHGGASIAADNEINGITFGGVGSGTIVDHCEVAMNVDDGFEFFGGTVNAKYLSSLFVGDDSFDTDKGYQGNMQYLLSMIGTGGHHSCEMDGNDGNAAFSAPSVMGLTAIGSGDNVAADAMMRLREGTGGAFANTVIAKGSGLTGIKHDRCDRGGDDGVAVTQSRGAGQLVLSTEDYLFVSSTGVVVHGATNAIDENCADAVSQLMAPATVSTTPFVDIQNDAREGDNAAVDPRPTTAILTTGDVAFTPWFENNAFSGAFAPGTSTWLSGWSYLDCVENKLVDGSCTFDPNNPTHVPALASGPVVPRPGTSYRTTCEAQCYGDTNGDRRINVDDLLNVLATFAGVCDPGESVPHRP